MSNQVALVISPDILGGNDFRRRLEYLTRVNTITLKRKIIEFITKMEEVISVKTNCSNSLKDIIDQIKKYEQNSCHGKKAGALLTIGSGVLGAGTYGLMSFTAAAVSGFLAPIFVGGLLGSGAVVSYKWLEKKKLKEKFSQIEAVIKIDKQATDKLISIAKRFFEEIEEYLRFINSYITSGYFPIHLDENSDFMQKVKLFFEYYLGPTLGHDIFEWINHLGNLICLYRPIFVQAIPSFNNSIVYTKFFGNQVLAGATLADDVVANTAKVGSRFASIIFFCGTLISILSGIKDYQDADRQAQEVNEYLQKLDAVTENIKNQLKSINDFGDQIKLYKDMIEAGPIF